MENSELLEKRENARLRRKKTELKKKALGLKLYSFYLSEIDSQYLMKIKKDHGFTNQEAIAYIFATCRELST